MGIVKLTAKFMVVVLMIYFLGLILEGKYGEMTNIVATFTSLIERIAAMDPQVLAGIFLIGFIAYGIFTQG